MRLSSIIVAVSLLSASAWALAKADDDDFGAAENYVTRLTRDNSRDVSLRVTGVSADMRTNIEAYVGRLTVEDLDNWRETVSRLRRSAREAMEALGYYQSEFQFERQKRQITIAVTANSPVYVRLLNISYLGEASNDVAFTALLDTLPLHQGDVFHHGRYENLKSRVQNLALERGYFDGAWERHEVTILQPDQIADIDLLYNSGLRYRLGKVTFRNKDESKPLPLRIDLLNKLVPFEPGQPYEADRIIRLNRALLDSRYFNEVRIRAEPATAVDQEIPVNVVLASDKPNQVDLGVGYATDIGPRLSAAWRRPLLNERGHSIEATSEVSQVRQSIDLRYGIPWSHPVNDTLQLIVGFKREDIDETTLTNNYILGVERQKKRPSGWQINESLRWSRESYEKDSGESGKSDLLLPGYSISRVRYKGSQTDPSSGDRQYYQFEFASPDLLSDADLISLRLGWRLLRTFADRHQLGLRLDAGSIFSSDFDGVPLNMRFYAGGDQSVRGYDYKSLGPRDSSGTIVGARNLASGSIEYTFKLTQRWRLATFVDEGNAFNAVSEGLKTGAGVGVRWISPVGPVRLDVAWGLSEENPSPHIHFFMGPAL